MTLASGVKHHKYATVSIDGDLVTVNGFPQPYVAKSRHEARRVDQLPSDALDEHVVVHGAVVVNAGRFTIRQQPWDVQLIERRRLLRWLPSLPIAQEQGCVEPLFDVARRSSIWQT